MPGGFRRAGLEAGLAQFRVGVMGIFHRHPRAALPEFVPQGIGRAEGVHLHSGPEAQPQNMHPLAAQGLPDRRHALQLAGRVG